jgi:hypothetical protein
MLSAIPSVTPARPPHAVRYGLHGNAILSRWPLTEPQVVRMGGMAPLFSSRGRETAGGYEKRLGGRMTLFALTGLGGGGGEGRRPAELLLGATHAQTSWWGVHSHTSAAIHSMQAHIEQAAPATSARGVLVAGDTWPTLCRWLGLRGLVEKKSPAARVVHGKVVPWGRGMDDYICGRGFTLAEPPTRNVGVGRPVQSDRPEFALCDHIFISAAVMLNETRQRHS